MDLKPQNKYDAVCIIDTELSYDFVAALDIDEEMPQLEGVKKKNSKVDLDPDQSSSAKKDQQLL